MVVHQPIADHFALLGVANHNRNYVTGIRQVRDSQHVELAPHRFNPLTLLFAFFIAVFQVADACRRTRSNRRWQRCAEDETACEAAYEINQIC